jgi:hypothetical protein
MFDFIGDKIKKMAKLLFWIGEILLALGGIASIIGAGAEGDAETAVALFIFVLVSALLLWGLCWLIYGFGQLIENSDALVALVDISKEDK